MIKKISVTGLYNLYDYSLSFEGGRYPICFISGPNGYGKTSILTLLNAVINQKKEVLLNANFDFSYLEVLLDKQMISISRTKTNRAPENQDEVDYLVELNIEIKDIKDNTLKDSVSITTDNGKDFPMTISMYLSSQSCLYLTDNRLFTGNESSEENIMNIYDEICKKMDEIEREMNFKLDYTRTMFAKNEKKEKPQTLTPEKMQQTKKLLDRYHNVGLLNSHFLDNASLSDPISISASVALEESSDLLQLEAFKQWIDDSAFSHKHLNMDIENGAVFNTDNGDLLLPMQLSSGEKQLYLQAYKLTIGASRGAIVLIDEPEMSYHPAWLTDYFDHITMAARSQDLQIILATHSPAIFGYDMDRYIDLYTLSHKEDDTAC